MQSQTRGTLGSPRRSNWRQVARSPLLTCQSRIGLTLHSPGRASAEDLLNHAGGNFVKGTRHIEPVIFGNNSCLRRRSDHASRCKPAPQSCAGWCSCEMEGGRRLRRLAGVPPRALQTLRSGLPRRGDLMPVRIVGGCLHSRFFLAECRADRECAGCRHLLRIQDDQPRIRE